MKAFARYFCALSLAAICVACGGGGVGVGGDSEGGGGAAPPPPPPQATQNAVKLNTQRNLAKAFMPFVQVWRQPGGLGVLREVFHGFSEEARTRGFPSPSLGGFGFIVATAKYNTWSVNRAGLPMSASGR